MKTLELAEALQRETAAFQNYFDDEDDIMIRSQLLGRLSRKYCGESPVTLCSVGFQDDEIVLKESDSLGVSVREYSSLDILAEDECYGIMDGFFGIGKGPYGINISTFAGGGPREAVLELLGDDADETIDNTACDTLLEPSLRDDLIQLLAESGFLSYYDVPEELLEHASDGLKNAIAVSLLLSMKYDWEEGDYLNIVTLRCPAVDAFFQYSREHDVEVEDMQKVKMLAGEIAAHDLVYESSAEPFYVSTEPFWTMQFYEEFGTAWQPCDYLFGILKPCYYGLFLELKEHLRLLDEKYHYLDADA